MNTPSVTTAGRPGETALHAGVAALGLVCAVGLLRVAMTLNLHVPFDLNEGWNAYHAVNAFSDRPLYPPVDSFLFNNYPPLSFYLVGALGLLTHDNILAGRAISLIAFICTGFGMMAAARALGAGWKASLFGALFFMTILAFDTNYVGMNDPQLLGHALGTAGLWLALRGGRGPGVMAFAVLLLSLAFFIKHNLIAQPIALFLWLVLVDRPAAARLSAWGLLFAATGVAGFQELYHRSLWSQLDTQRLYSWASGRHGLTGWLEMAGLPIAASLGALAAFSRHRAALFCAIYLLISFAVGAYFKGGDGTVSNVLFDNAIALGLCASVGYAFLSQSGQRAWLAPAYVVCFILPVAGMLAVRAAQNDFYPRYWLDRQNEAVTEAARDISLIGSQKEPVLCGALALCYWAGKPAELDEWGMNQAILTNNRGNGALVAAITGRRYAILAINLSYSGLWSVPSQNAARANYRMIRMDEFASFWVRR